MALFKLQICSMIINLLIYSKLPGAHGRPERSEEVLLGCSNPVGVINKSSHFGGSFFVARKGVHLVSLKENFDTSTPQGRLMLTIIAAINAFERENILERQREGIAIAKVEGKYKGRKPVEVEDFAPHYEDYMSRRTTKGQLAKKLHISRPTLNRLFEEYVCHHPELKTV